MKKLVSTLHMDKKQWLKYSKQGIGGSDAGAVCGLNPYKTAIQVYYDKTSDEIEAIDNEAMRQGREFEDYVARRFTEATGKKVRRANAMFYDYENNPFMIADVDRMVVGENAGLECKTASPYMADKWQNGPPAGYLLQSYHYMSVCHADAWYIAVLIYGREFKYYRIERDEEMIADLIRIEKDFWENCVLSRQLPDPDGSKIADTVIAEYFKTSKSEIIPLTGFDDKLKRRQELMAVIDKMETEKKQIEQQLKLYLGEAEQAENENFLVSWKAVNSNRLDEKLLKKEQPQIYEKYRKIITSRRFAVKTA